MLLRTISLSPHNELVDARKSGWWNTGGLGQLRNVSQTDREFHTLSLCQEVWRIISVFIREVAIKRRFPLLT